MRKSVRAALCAAVAMLAHDAANARVIEIPNGDFETGPPLQEGVAEPASARPIAGWTDSAGLSTSRWNPSVGSYADHAAHGYVAALGGSGISTTPNGTMLAQTVRSEVLRANTRYVLTVDVGKRAGSTSYWGYEFGLVSNLGLPGATILGRKRGNDAAAGSFNTVSFEFETGDTGPGIGKRFAIALGGQSSPFGDFVAYDNVRLEAFSLAGVPEPSSWAMMIGGFGLAGAAMRRRKSMKALA